MKPTQILKLVRALVASGVIRFDGCGISFSVEPPSVVAAPTVVQNDRDWETWIKKADYNGATAPNAVPVPASSEGHRDVLAQLIGKARPVTRVG